MKRIFFAIASLLALVGLRANAQADSIAAAVKLDSCVASFFKNYKCDFRPAAPMGLDSCIADHEQRILRVYAKEGFAGQIFTPAKVSSAYGELRRCLPAPFDYYDVRLTGFGREISELVPNIYRQQKDASRLWRKSNSGGGEWTRNISRPITVGRGLQGVHLAVWPSHGRYYDNAKNAWRWQRPNLWCTTEDMFTRSIVVPFLLPMLERAGAVAFCPCERDWHKEEALGRIAADSAAFCPNFSVAGDYAVYVRYPLARNAAADALYTVKHGGVDTRIRVNQQIGGGVWVYLGTFHFAEGQSPANSVSLSGITDGIGEVLRSEVRIGGGMGSVARGGTTSGMPRFLEGSRYYAEYSGFPQYVYDTKDGNNDYADDINARSNMVNYLAGSSPFLPVSSGSTGSIDLNGAGASRDLPDTTGLCVPIELSLAVHSDAGFFRENKPYGTLTIYTLNGDDGADSLPSGVSRMANSDLACIMQADICRDLSAALGREWPRRSVYNRNYSESRKPEVPSMILETLSHQNFQDMLYGHDPNFKMILARSIYKSIVRFVAEQHGRNYAIQPLPITHFRADVADGQVHLSWRAQPDSLEPSAVPAAYIVYTARENEDFDNGIVVSGGKTDCTVSIERDKIYRFKITACNDGGESDFSETLTALSASREQEKVLIVNGFTRLSSPAVIETAEVQGFDIKSDIGVPYINTAEYCGEQISFLRSNIGSTAQSGLGYSGSELEGRVIAGNSFDYPHIHAIAIRNEEGERSISSCSMEALLEQGDIGMDYSLVDIIFGLQKDDGVSSIKSYKTFSPELRSMLKQYLDRGGNIAVSGAYVGSDMKTADEQQFTASTLGYTSVATADEDRLRIGGTTFSLVHEWNPYRYAVQKADVLTPADNGEAFANYESGECAAVCTDNTVVMGFPLEAVNDADDRRVIMNRIIQKLLYKF